MGAVLVPDVSMLTKLLTWCPFLQSYLLGPFPPYFKDGLFSFLHFSVAQLKVKNPRGFFHVLWSRLEYPWDKVSLIEYYVQ